ncbi:MAG TPA: ATP-dependent DNA ligase, partial [Sphingobacteriaceae bacterium]|nr:ATP-dependent DNA ligase [Sphingobacteriaceae bacterium]
MKEFSLLFLALESTNKTSKKIEVIRQFLQDAPDEDKRWFLALFTGKRPKRSVSTKSMRQWALELTNLPEWLLAESYAAVGDLGETISLILPPVENHVERNLSEW